MIGFGADVAADAAGAGLLAASSIFLGTKAAVPSKPENVGPYCILVETGGSGAVLAHDQRYPQPSLQVRICAASATVARAMAGAWHARYCNLHNVVLNGTKYERVVAVQEVLDLQTDAANRPQFGFNINGKQTQ